MATPQPLVPAHLSSPLEPQQQKQKQKQKHPAKFQCRICPRRFTRAFNLHSHIRTHTGDRPYSCSQCDKSFTRQHDRAEHEKLHSGEKPFACLGELEDGSIRKTGCGKRFARRAQLTRHVGSCTRSMIRKGEAEQQRQQRTTIVIEDTPEPTAAPPISQLLAHSAPLSDDCPSSNDALLFPHPPVTHRPSPPPSTEPARPVTTGIEATPEPFVAPPISKPLTHSVPMFHSLPLPTYPIGAYQPHSAPWHGHSINPNNLLLRERILFACGGDLEDGSSRRHGCGRWFSRRTHLNRHLRFCAQSTDWNAATEQQGQQHTTADIEATPETTVAPPISKILTYSALLFDYPSSNDTLPFSTDLQGMRRRSPPPHQNQPDPSQLQAWQRALYVEEILQSKGKSLTLLRVSIEHLLWYFQHADGLVRAGYNVDAELRALMQHHPQLHPQQLDAHVELRAVMQQHPQEFDAAAELVRMANVPAAGADSCPCEKQLGREQGCFACLLRKLKDDTLT